MQDKDYEYYKDFDMTGAARGIHPIVKRLQVANEHREAMRNAMEQTDAIFALEGFQPTLLRQAIKDAKLSGKVTNE